ncbi:TRAP transporter small permease subunit [uncultured Kushneria sp.]|uniref:TRAP transporter small permease n=1 Tax=uncultured Kushneria sp. TaxID=905033 RepID=UPI002618D55E|nr:TRAP transporter small permease subunit [uncultured Kushneria sp.]
MSRLYCRLRASVVALLAFSAGLCMALLFAIVLINALMRYFLGSSLAWGGQLPIFLGIYGVMFGIALAYLQDRHIRLGLVVDALSPGIRERLFLLVDVSVIMLGSTLAVAGMRFVESRGGMRVSGMTGIADSLATSTNLALFKGLGTLAPYQFAMVVGGVLLLLAGILRLIDRLAMDRTATTTPSEGSI